MAQSIHNLRVAARDAEMKGDALQAARAHAEIVRDWPDALDSWTFLIAHAAQREDFDACAQALEGYLKIDDVSVDAWRSLGIAEMRCRHWHAAQRAFEQACRLAPEARLNLIYLGGAARLAGDRELAAACLSLGLQGIPAEELKAKDASTEPVLSGILDGAMEFLETFLEDLITQGAAMTGHLTGARWRFFETADPKWNDQQQRPDRFFLEGVAPNAWYDTENLPWAADLEDEFGAILEEVQAGLVLGDASPYIAGHTAEADHWPELADNDDWGAIHLYSGGQANQRQLAKFPKTMAALEKLPLCRANGKPVEVFFSLLHPGGHIVPHHGTSNARLTVHLPIIVPEEGAQGVILRVGGETRRVEAGKLLTFDDSFLHEARNEGAGVRINLIFEVWNPALSDDEIEQVASIMDRFDRWFMGRGRRLVFLGVSLAEAVQANKLYHQAREAIGRRQISEGEGLMRQTLALNPGHVLAGRYFETIQ